MYPDFNKRKKVHIRRNNIQKRLKTSNIHIEPKTLIYKL